MYHESYHQLSEENLNWMLAGESVEHQNIIRKQVSDAIAAKTRTYLVILPDGTYYLVDNGIVQGSKNTR